MPKKVMLINYVPGEECRIAVLVDTRVEELYQERASSESHVGNIYKGRVTNVEPSIQAAFVDFGLERNGFLHISDLHPKYFHPDQREETESVGLKTPRRERPLIQKCLRKGQEVLVQILKEGLGNKGPTLTTYLSIPGRFLVMMPNMEKLGVSRKVEDDDARRAMKRILDELNPPKGFGFIVRTAGIGRTRSEIHRDLIYLQRLWRSIDARMKNTRIGELFAESDLLIRTIRDVYSSDIVQIIVDDPDAAQRASDFLAITDPQSKANVLYYNDPIPLFHRYGVEKQIETINSRVVPLPSGGSLVIETTEALVAIDVNSGKNRDNRDADQTAYRVNMEAADEICRQIRLRDLGGVIVNDLIDMRNPRHRRDVENRFEENLKEDRARTRTHPISQFGILEMTRQRMRPSLAKSVYMDCPACTGTGIIKNPESVALEAMRKVAVAMQRDVVTQIELTVSPDVAFHLLNRKRVGLVKLEQAHGKPVLVRVNSNGPLDAVSVTVYNAAGQVLEPEISINFPQAKVEQVTPSVNPEDDGLMEEIKQTMEEADRERTAREERLERERQQRLERQLAEENAVAENVDSNYLPDHDLPLDDNASMPDRDDIDDDIAARASTRAVDFASEINQIVDDSRPADLRPSQAEPSSQPQTAQRQPAQSGQGGRHRQQGNNNRHQHGQQHRHQQKPDHADARGQRPADVSAQHGNQHAEEPVKGHDYSDDRDDAAHQQEHNADHAVGEGEGGRKRRRRRRRRGGRGQNQGQNQPGNQGPYTDQDHDLDNDNFGNVMPRRQQAPQPLPEHDEHPDEYNRAVLEPIDDVPVEIGKYQGAPVEKLILKKLTLADDLDGPQPGNVRLPDPVEIDESNEPNGNIKPPPQEEEQSGEFGQDGQQEGSGRRKRRRRGGRGRNKQADQAPAPQAQADPHLFSQTDDTHPGSQGAGDRTAEGPEDTAIVAETENRTPQTEHVPQATTADEEGQPPASSGRKRRGRRGRGRDREQDHADQATRDHADRNQTASDLSGDESDNQPAAHGNVNQEDNSAPDTEPRKPVSPLAKIGAPKLERVPLPPTHKPAPLAFAPVAPSAAPAAQSAPAASRPARPAASAMPSAAAPAEPARQKSKLARTTPPSKSALSAANSPTAGRPVTHKPQPKKPYTGFRSLKKVPASEPASEPAQTPSADINSDSTVKNG